MRGCRDGDGDVARGRADYGRSGASGASGVEAPRTSRAAEHSEDESAADPQRAGGGDGVDGQSAEEGVERDGEVEQRHMERRGYSVPGVLRVVTFMRFHVLTVKISAISWAVSFSPKHSAASA